MKRTWECTGRRLWLLVAFLLATSSLAADNIMELTTTEPPDPYDSTQTVIYSNFSVPSTMYSESISSLHTSTQTVPYYPQSTEWMINEKLVTSLVPLETTMYEEVEENDEPFVPSLEFKFTRTFYNVSIPESSPGKTFVTSPEKMGIFTNEWDIRFKIVNGDRDKYFKAEERLVGNFCFLMIRTRTGNSVLNRERKDRYVLEIKAVGSVPGFNTILEATTVVDVSILDVNDLSPLFYPSLYEATVSEDTPLHKSILKVNAEDADLGRNGEIYYSFLEPTELFSVHPMTGVISLTRPLRFQESSFYELTVVAKDRGVLFRGTSLGKASTAKVKIRVREVNLFAPEIYVQGLPRISENAQTEIYAIVRVVDRDEGVHGEIKSLDIVDGDPDGHFRIKPASKSGEYNIEVLKFLDREATPRGYNLTLRAIDKGVPPKQSFKSVPVLLSDLNDNSPVFDREIYEIDVPETAPVNTPVIRLKVTDADEGKNAQVFLEIVGGNEGGEFRINPESGMLYTAVQLDAETKSIYTLTVSAIDQGNVGTRKQSSAKVKINVVDTNDNDPIFEKCEISIVIDENEPAGTSVYKVTAKDADSGENAYISYSIANLNPVPFEIDHFSGTIKTTQVIDYESMKRQYILRVRASDWGVPYRRQTEMQLKIRIRDVNDNRPQFEKVDCIGHVSRSAMIGSEILTLSAIDFDSGNIISYRLVSGNEDNCFALDSTSGIISVTCDLKDIRKEVRTINVTATDGTHFADITRIDIHLVNTKPNPTNGYLLNDELGAFQCRDTGVARRLTEVLAAAESSNMPNRNKEEFAMLSSRFGENLHSPEFISFPVEIRVNESVPLGTSLDKILARDRDLGYNGKLVFGISNGDQDSVFRIDPDTGELKVIGYLDRERVDEYFLNISVFDLGKPQKSISRLLPVIILDINDNAPKFEKKLASFRVTENALNGTAIFRVNATDADLGNNAKVTYSLVTDTEDFAIDSTQGVLYVSSKLDREKQDLYELKIRATDGGNRQPLFSDAVVRVQIDDVNDNAPTFALTTYVVKVREDIPVSSVVAVVTASDPDVGQGAEVRYFLSGGSDIDGVFVVDKMSGTIRTVKPLDFEERQIHSLVIRARDRGSPSLSSETTVLVEVVDVNENIHAPVFSDVVMTSSVRENAPVGTLVTTVKAVDDDPPGDDSRISYYIRGGDGVGFFSIDNEGHIKTQVVLDIETKKQYWLTVVAEDHGVVPLHSFIEVYIAVENENDNTPLTDDPIYYVSIPENSGSGKLVAHVHATDADVDENNQITYRITAGNPEGFFTIDTETGIIKTTNRKLDRENQAEHILEVTVSDNGVPSLSSSTRVIVTVTDINDHTPTFDKPFYKFKVLATNSVNHPLFQVLAVDEDESGNAFIEYSIKSGRGKGKFKIHPRTGVVYSQKSFQAGQEYDLLIKAVDNGNPQKSSTTRVSVSAVAVDSTSENPPRIKNPNQQVQVTESDAVLFFVAHIQATDDDGDLLWYNIVDGDTRDEFFIGRDTGNILLAKKLDRETQNLYNLTISVTDGVHTVYTQLYVMVIDSNDHRPEFSKKIYKVDISENVEPETEILELAATDDDEDDKVYYSLHSSRSPTSYNLFNIDSITGAVTLRQKLDREVMDQHLLTVMVKDQGTPSKRNYARVLIRVHDHNDHAPEFTNPIIQAKVYETCELGTNIAKVVAIDKDRDENAQISYSIISGNVGNVFVIDPHLGDIQVTRPLDINTISEYMLNVKATDNGSPPLSSTIHVHVMVTMADNAPPRFLKREFSAEIFENQPSGTYVAHVEARTTSSLFFELINGNIDDMFFINPSTGVILTKNNLDYEVAKVYNLTVEATNMAGAKAKCFVIVHVLDKNDNPPHFLLASYTGFIIESANIGSLVLTSGNAPLVIKAQDADSETNALLNYDIVEAIPRRYFHIDSTTGAVRTVMSLDHETVSQFSFHVKVSDLGKPKLSSETTAKVNIIVTDINDCPPTFKQSEFNCTLLLPTYSGVAILQLNATDKDSPEKTNLRYDIIEGNKGNPFQVDSKIGLVTVMETKSLKKFHKIHVRVSDGEYSSVAYLNIKVEKSENSGLIFQKSVYHGAIMENSTKISTVAVVNVLGSALNEHIKFSILNPTDMFNIGGTSGAIRTTGKKFDREVQDKYELIVEARSMDDIEIPRIAHVIVNITILDINDNCPMFVNLPYYAVVPIDAKKTDTIVKVHAVDMDKGENGEVRYELIKGNGELFKVCRKTGEIELKQNLEGHNREYELIIAAYDGGMTPCSTEVPVHIKIIDKSMPVFDKQFYSVTVSEDIELHAPLSVSIQAESPLDRKLIYSIVRGNDYEEFALDFNTGEIYVVDELDYETKRQYELTIRATDSVSGVYAEVFLSILVQDVNDSPPEFSKDSFNISVSEADPFGTSVLKVVATDKDTGINQKIYYHIKNDSSSSQDYFYIDPEEGTIFLKRSLDHEMFDSHHFTVVAVDSGVPSLSSTAHVWVTVLDMNDNPPRFEQPSYTCMLSDSATRGQFVTILTASDPDYVDQDKLYYTIVGGNEQQIFTIEPSTGIISLINLQNFAEVHQYLLNVSVSDGVYTSFSRVRIEIVPANKHNPVFAQHQIEVKVQENQPRGTIVTTVQAKDKDFGKYGDLSYFIQSEMLREIFDMNKNTGEITTKKKLDREMKKLYEVPVTCADAGGRLGFLTVRVKIGDENDNAPVFQSKEYKTTIPSNLTVNSGFLKVRANDLDEDINSEIQYSIYEIESSVVTELFGVNSQSGGIYLIKSAVPYENQVFQFFIRATDHGLPPKYSDVPVEIYIMGSQDIAPMFERRDDKFFMSENSAPGSLITKLKLVTNVTVKFRIVSNEAENPMFSIDEQGQLTLARPLDREVKDTYFIGVLAETESSPSLTALTEVTLKVLDENDNAPYFESAPYRVTLAENIEEGSSILKVTAHDKDLGNNGEVRYSLSQDSGELANIVAVDVYTGWIRTLVLLDRETAPEYSFQIIATDNGQTKHFARTTVYIKLRDYNDNPPVFVSKHYNAAVNEDALPGTVVVQLNTTDADDVKSRVEYYIISGDIRSQFQIRQTGEVFVAKPLDREMVSKYILDITATDGKFIATTKVTIEILDANDNPPYCLRYRYRDVLSEGVHPGTWILTVLANDIDEDQNSNLRYYLTGDGADKFKLDSSTGHLKTNFPLDREEQSKYQLTAHVQDRDQPGWECSSQVEILISDLNDNAPQFSMETYSATLAEDAQVGTLVTKIHATDKDLGINRKIRYSFVDSANEHFRIAADSGIVTLNKPLDREQKSVYNLTVKAVDQGTPHLSKTTTLLVLVLDINDNPPEFASKFYYVTLPESISVGTEVAVILATSKDSGINAEVFYSIVGGNEHKKFDIHSKTGVITVVEQLDFERAKEYFLTIQAVDGGTPPLSNHASINITVTDSNDNPPVFKTTSYSATVREDAELGDKILQVEATDLDSGVNGKINYTIEKGDRHKQFMIDEESGYISVRGPLDRETTSSYVLEVLATDQGEPKLSNYILVNLEISDANDNPPIFSQANYSAIIQEDKPPGTSVLKFHVTDADTVPNTAPYTFDFRSGNDGAVFQMAQDGTLLTAAKFNHRSKDNYLLQVRVFDNGTPPMFSDTYVAVKIIEESQYPPVITPLEITINSFEDHFPGGIIGKVHASDQDKYDTLTYALAQSSISSNPTRITDLFQIDKNDGTLTALPMLDVGEYLVNVTVTDGKYTASTIVKVNVDLISPEMLENAIIVRFRDISPLDFVLSYRKSFIRATKNALSVRTKDITIISVQNSEGRKRSPRQHIKGAVKYNNEDRKNKRKSGKNGLKKDGGNKVRRTRQIHTGELLDVLFCVKKPTNSEYYFSPDSMRVSLSSHLDEYEQTTGLIVEEIVRDTCTNTHCVYGMCRDKFVLETEEGIAIATDVTSFVAPRHEHKIECSCKEGYAGDRCEIVVNECARIPCPPYKLCVPDGSIQGFICQCPEGYGGPTCDTHISECHDISCYTVRNPISFSGKSYVQYHINKTLVKKVLHEETSLSMRIRTMQQTGNLMYVAGKVDFNILEIQNGVVQYRFDLGSGEGLVRVSSVFVSDGQWHKITLDRSGSSAKLEVDEKHIAQGSAPGVSDILNVQSNDLYLAAEVHGHATVLGYEDLQRGFVGCMDDVRIGGIAVPLHMTGASMVAILKRFYNVEFKCDPSLNITPLGPCGSQPCQNGGTCRDLGDDTYQCSCHSRFEGLNCEVDTDPCQSSPCLYGGQCSPLPPSDYKCECTPRLSGKRCQYGRHCSPNPCRNGGVCEEGDAGPLCKCRGFTGELCSLDLDECRANPCLNGATCINSHGSYRCQCNSGFTGFHCSTSIYSSPISSSIYSLTLEELVGIIFVLFTILLLVGVFILFRKIRSKRPRPGTNHINNDTRKDALLNSNCKPNETDFKRGSKLSNLEISQRDTPPGPPRPASYTPSTTDPVTAVAALNNLDTLRSYGSAGDELESDLPPDYLRNLNRTNPLHSNNPSSDIDSLCKPSWNGNIPLVSFSENNIKNDLKLGNTKLLEAPNRLLTSKGQTKNIHHSEEDQRYHWDCSDWARQDSRPLPNITEVPGSEVPDSSSFHSNESNESNNHHGILPPVHGPIDPARDIETLNEDQESEYVGDSECGTELNYSDNPHLNTLDSGGEDYRFHNSEIYKTHPNTYLPKYNIQSDDTHNEDSDDEYIGYGFPRHERSALLGSHGNLSMNVCDIDDADLDSPELKILNPKEWKSGSVQQTAV